jgi:hypothetical protein
VRGLTPAAVARLGTQQLTTLARRLTAATVTGDIEWQGREDDCYRWTSGAGSVSVASRDRDGEPPYEVAVYNTRDEKVDGLSSELLADEPAPWNEALSELYRVARRNALHADEVVEALIGALAPRGNRRDAAEAHAAES